MMLFFLYCCWPAYNTPECFHLLGVYFMDGSIRKAVVMEETHLLIEQAVDDVSPRILPLHQTHQLAIQRGAQIHRPVVAVQRHLKNQW